LVAKSWINPSRRRLFKTVEIRETTLQSWLDNIPPANDGLLQHVRSLSYITDSGAEHNALFPCEHRVDVLRDYFPSLRRLRHLSLSSMHLPSSIPQEAEMFPAFRHTLSRLSLDYFMVTISALVTLINYFPNLNRLDLSRLFHKVDGEPAPPLSRPLIGQLHVSEFHQDILDLLDQLSELGSVLFDEIILTEYPRTRVRTLERIVNAAGAGVKRLRLSSGFAACMYTTCGSAVRLTKSNTIFPQTILRHTDLRYSLAAESSGN
jgi:hypothetical protein